MDQKQWQETLKKGKLNEAVDNTDEFIKSIEKTIKKHFPKSPVTVSYSDRLIPNITFWFTVGKKGDWEVTWHNDISPVTMVIYGFEKDGTMKDKLEFVPNLAGSFVVKPGPDSYMAYDRVKVPVRKKTGTPDQVLKSIDKYFADLKSALKTNKDRFSKNHEYAKKYI